VDISATFQLTAREYRTVIRNAPGMRGLAIIGPMMLACGLFSLLSDRHVVWLIWAGIILPVSLELSAVRLATRRSAALFSEPWTVRITDQTYTLRTPESQAEVGWSAYRDASYRGGFWYLRQTNGMSGFLPKRAFGEAQQTELAEFFARRLPPKKKRSSKFFF
jgi:hypothetical protein